MSQLKELLDRQARQIDAAPDALDVMFRARDRRRRNQRVATVVIALVLAVAEIGRAHV